MIEVEAPDGTIFEVETNDPQVARDTVNKYLSSKGPAKQEFSRVFGEAQPLVQSAATGFAEAAAGLASLPRAALEGVELAREAITKQPSNVGELSGLPEQRDVLRQIEKARGVPLYQANTAPQRFARAAGAGFVGGVPGVAATLAGQGVEEGLRYYGAPEGVSTAANIATTLGVGVTLPSLAAGKAKSFERGLAEAEVGKPATQKGQKAEILTGKVRKLYDESTNQVGAAFRQAEASGVNTLVDPGFARREMTENILPYLGRLDVRASGLPPKVIDFLEGKADDLNLNDLEQVRRVFSQLQKSGDATTAMSAKNAVDALEQALDTGFKTGQIQGPPKALQDWRNAIALRRKQAILFDGDGAKDFVGKIVEKKAGVGGPEYRLTADEVGKIVFGGGFTSPARATGANRAFAEIMKAAEKPEDKAQVYAALKQGMLHKLLETSFGKGANADKIDAFGLADKVREITRQSAKDSIFAQLTPRDQQKLLEFEKELRKSAGGNLPEKVFEMAKSWVRLVTRAGGNGLLSGEITGKSPLQFRSLEEVYRHLGGRGVEKFSPLPAAAASYQSDRVTNGNE